MNDGITIQEACALHAAGTQDDYNKNCNPDGTVKIKSDSTTFSLAGEDSLSITLENTYVYTALLILSLIVLFAIALIFKRVMHKHQRQSK